MNAPTAKPCFFDRYSKIQPAVVEPEKLPDLAPVVKSTEPVYVAAKYAESITFPAEVDDLVRREMQRVAKANLAKKTLRQLLADGAVVKRLIPIGPRQCAVCYSLADDAATEINTAAAPITTPDTDWPEPVFIDGAVSWGMACDRLWLAILPRRELSADSLPAIVSTTATAPDATATQASGTGERTSGLRTGRSNRQRRCLALRTALARSRVDRIDVDS